MLQLIKPSEVRTVAGGSGVEGRRGVIYQTIDEEPSRLYWWNGSVHVPMPTYAESLGVSRLAGAFAWAARPSAASYSGREIVITDFATPAPLRSDGTNWRAMSPVLVSRNRTLLAGLNQTGEQYLGNISTPGGLLFSGATLEWRQGYARSDATDATSSTVQRLGPLGTISDPAPTLLSQFALTSAARAAGTSAILKVTSSGTLVREGNAGVGSPPFSTSGSATAYGTASAVQDLTAAIYFGASCTLAAATGGATPTVPQVTSQELWLLP